MGVRGLFLQLLFDYLMLRTQRVRVDSDCYSLEESNTEYGVPQGSVLGPTLFLIYINDLTETILLNGKIVSYADDTALLFHGKSWEEVIKLAFKGLYKVTKWLDNNLLTLNTNKTNYIKIGRASCRERV